MVAVQTSDSLPTPFAEQFARWVDQITTTDGVRPFNDLGMRIGQGTRAGELFWISQDDQLDALAMRDPVDGSVQLAVSPDRRRIGLGRTLAHSVSAQRPCSWWSFGTLPGAEGLAAELGLVPVRQLLKMSRDLIVHPANPVTANDQVVVRHFTRADISELVRVNARAFADHPEQGAMTAADVELAMTEEWFDATDLLVAHRPGSASAQTVLGYHWMKREPRQPGVAEVYVLGVDPDVERRGLGRLLLDAGLAQLADRGVTKVELYVEAGNERVVRMYQSASFDIELRDTAWAAAARA